jgi:tRNA dimethylallyltransferase
MQSLIAIIGPTASGKTALGEAMALKFNGEIISADAKQVYRGMDIGTAKEKVLRVPQHLIDIKNPGEKITVAEFQTSAYYTIEDIIERRKLPFLVGGSMLYAEAVMNGYTFGEGALPSLPRYRVLKLGIDLPREELKMKAAKRLRERIDQGLVDEVRGLLDAGISPAWLEACGIEYRYFSRYVRGVSSLSESIRLTEIATNQYIKRQYTWWRRHDDILWLQKPEQAEAAIAHFVSAE